MITLRHALRSNEPWDLLLAVSGLMTATDPRMIDPFTPDRPHHGIDVMVESFTEFNFAETTAALTVIRALVADDIMAARIGRVLESRRQPMPSWLGDLHRTSTASPVWFLTHVLGDGDDYVFEVTLPTGEPLTALVYVDHNLGGVVKEAFVTPSPLQDVVDKLASMLDGEQTLEIVDAAHARAVIEQAIDNGAHLYPPPTTDTWPLCRPLVEWMTRLLPAGAAPPQIHEWSEAELTAITDDFFSSPHAAILDGPDDRDLLGSILWFASGYGSADPYQWSQVRVEILLADWFPRKVVADTAYLSRMPTVLRAFIRYCHDRRQIPSGLTTSTLAAVDEWEPDYQQAIRSQRPQGAHALAASMLPSFEDTFDEDESIATFLLSSLERRVGGRAQLMNLDTAPLPDEPFEWAGIPEDIRPVVDEVLATCDRVTNELLDAEYRTAIRRLLGRVAVGDPVIFRRKSSPARTAATVAWLVYRANTDVQGGPVLIQDLLAAFGVKGSLSQRAEPMLRAVGVNPYELYGRMELRAPDLLTSTARSAIISLRDRYLLMDEED